MPGNSSCLVVAIERNYKGAKNTKGHEAKAFSLCPFVFFVSLWLAVLLQDFDKIILTIFIIIDTRSRRVLYSRGFMAREAVAFLRPAGFTPNDFRSEYRGIFMALGQENILQQ